MEITWTWTFRTPFSIGSGMSAAWEIDHLIAMRNGQPLLRGDACKGAIRMSAERLVRWLYPQTPGEEDDQEARSFSRHPALRRIFEPQAQGPNYTFHFAKPLAAGGIEPAVRFATAIEEGKGVAKEHTLRSRQVAPAEYAYSARVEVRGGVFSDPQGQDYKDLMLLLTAIVCCDAIGGKRGGGLGEVAISNLGLTLPCFAAGNLLEAQTIEVLREYVMQGVVRHEPAA